jgi:hypothetical protein
VRYVNGNANYHCCGVVVTRWWGLGILSLAPLAPAAAPKYVWGRSSSLGLAWPIPHWRLIPVSGDRNLSRRHFG